MSIQSEITRITNKRNQSFTKVASKGVTVPSGSTIDDLPDLIDLIEVHDTYSITKTLTNVSSSNDDTKVIAGNSFYMDLTPATGCSLRNITVTMGGVDITSQVFTPGTGEKAITVNGTYNASADYLSGYSSVTVNVPSSSPSLGTKTITENGTYTASSDSLDGYSSVMVNVPSSSPVLGTKTITENGTYTASSDLLDGYSSVTVAVSSGGGTTRRYIIRDGIIQSGFSFSTSSSTTVTEESDGYVKIYVNGNAYGAAYVNGVDFTNYNTAVLCLHKVDTRYGSSYQSSQYPAFSLGSGNAASNTTPDSYKVIMNAAKGNITTDVFALRTENYSSGGNIKLTAAGYSGHTYAEIFIKDLYLDSFTL